MEQVDLERAIGRVEGKLDLVVTSISELKNAFDTMEKGRLSRLEVLFATLETQISVKARSTAMWTSAALSILTSVAAGVIIYLILHHGS